MFKILQACRLDGFLLSSTEGLMYSGNEYLYRNPASEME